jgi:hypothetical protein
LMICKSITFIKASYACGILWSLDLSIISDTKIAFLRCRSWLHPNHQGAYLVSEDSDLWKYRMRNLQMLDTYARL